MLVRARKSRTTCHHSVSTQRVALAGLLLGWHCLACPAVDTGHLLRTAGQASSGTWVRERFGERLKIAYTGYSVSDLRGLGDFGLQVDCTGREETLEGIGQGQQMTNDELPNAVSEEAFGPLPPAQSLSPLPQEEYIEQAHFFAVLGERLEENMPAQEVLGALREEVLATTKLPMAIDFLLAELKHQGILATGMRQLGHYFTPFQCFVMGEAENDRRRFDLRIGLQILSREAQYRSETTISRPGLFLYQFEALCRNRLSYDQGLEAIAADPAYDPAWRDWILTVRRQIGIVELADMLYVRSVYYQEKAAKTSESVDSTLMLFGRQEGRIAWANRQKEPLLLFAALHRQLGYPQVPRTREADLEQQLLPSLARRVEQLESRLKLVEEEQRGGINLERFYQPDQAGPSSDSP